MTPFWVEVDGEQRIAIVLRPRGWDWLEDDLTAMRNAGVDVLVSMLTSAETDELGLSQEAELCTQAGLIFRSFPISDRETPESTAAFRRFIALLRGDLRSGKRIASHCRASIGRASVILACLLIEEGMTAQNAFQLLSETRGANVPDTPEQVQWVTRYAESI